jgi:two-component system sensor histidine kinase PilS (NtrC family)
MIGRVIIITLFLGSSATLELGFRAFTYPSFLYVIIAVTYFLTIPYAILLSKLKRLRLLTEIQLSVDVFIATWVVYITGGIESWFPFTYLLIIIAGSIILYSYGGFLVASLSSILYGGVLVLQYYRVLPITQERYLIETDYLYNLFINITAFYLVAYLSGGLSERLKRAGEKLKEKDADLTELKAFSDNVIRSMTSGLFTTDSEGRITFFNKAAEDITGWRLEEIKGWEASVFFPIEGVSEAINPELVSGQDSRLPGLALRSGAGQTPDPRPQTPYRFEGEFYRRDGRRLVLGMGISYLRGRDDRPSGFIGVFQDLTRIKEMEEDIKGKERMAAIGELSSWMAHEIRNPLASLSGSIQVLKENIKPTEENIHLIEIALRETERLNLIVGDFLNYARPRPLSLELCDINSLIQDTLSLLENSREFHEGIKINKAIGDGTIEAMVDPNQMKQVFWNLSLNALQAMPDGGELTIDSRFKTQDSTIEITFKDTGVGIKKADLDYIFFPFFSTKEGGSGLGLAIAYRVIEDHNGKIKVESEVGKGTTFRVYLPQKTPDSRPKTQN